MHAEFEGPVLVVCGDERLARSILGSLDDHGLTAVGPAPTAGLALTLAAQAAPRVAILAGNTTGRRTAAELAGELRRTWGVECYELPAEAPSPAGRRPGLTARLR